METPKNVYASSAGMLRKYQDMILENSQEKEEVEEAKEEETDDDKE